MKIIKALLSFCLVWAMTSCAIAKEPYQQIELSYNELKGKMDKKDSFYFMVVRDGCDFCESLYAYIDQTKDENHGVILYTVDITDYDFSKEEEGSKKLKSDTEEGKYLLSLCPYFLYTPSIYQVKDGEIVSSAIGFSDVNKTVSLWDLDSFIDFDEAETVNFWEYLKQM